MKHPWNRRLVSLLLACLLAVGLTTPVLGAEGPALREESEILMISGVTVTPESLAGYFAQDRSFTYDFDNKLLTLRGTINGGPALALYSSVQGLVIWVEQDATLKNEMGDVVWLEGDTTIVGPGQLSILGTEEDSGAGLCVANEATLTLNQCKLYIEAKTAGLTTGEGGAGLSICGSSLQVKAREGAAIDGFDGGIWLTEAEITTPADGIVAENGSGAFGIYGGGTLAGEVQIEPVQTVYHTLSFVLNGHGRAIDPIQVAHGKTANRPANPSEEGWVFGGWYLDRDCTRAFSFTSPVEQDMTLYARWTPDENPFSDVETGKYYYAAVQWAYNHQPQITGGTDESHFSPKQTCTREQVVTFLYAANGCPDLTNNRNPFTDVAEGKYYYKAVLWANQHNPQITGGVTETTFGVKSPCKREQVVTFLWKAAGAPEPQTQENPFTDVRADKYYYKAVLWAVENGITSGMNATTFGVGQTCTRAQIVTFLFAAY